MFGMLYVVSMLGFAYRVYPFIPAQKPGGDFSTEKRVRISLTKRGSAFWAGRIDDQVDPFMDYAVLYESPSAIYLAPTRGSQSGGGPRCWRWGAFCSAATEAQPLDDSGYRPQVTAVNRECVASLQVSR